MSPSFRPRPQMGRTQRRGARPIQAHDASGNIDRRQLLNALTRLKRGDFTVRLDEAHSGVDGKISDAFNQVVELNQRISVELARLSQLVGKEGRISERASLGDVQGSPRGNHPRRPDGVLLGRRPAPDRVERVRRLPRQADLVRSRRGAGRGEARARESPRPGRAPPIALRPRDRGMALANSGIEAVVPPD